MRRIPSTWRLLFAGLAAAGASLPSAAQSDVIYRCIDEQGHKSYQNTGAGKGCERADGLLMSTPAPPARGDGRPAAAPAPSASPASFPRIDSQTQRLRDGERQRILEEELRGEEERLARLRAEFNQGQPLAAADETTGSPRYRERTQRLSEDIQRAEANVASLRRELAPQHY